MPARARPTLAHVHVGCQGVGGSDRGHLGVDVLHLQLMGQSDTMMSVDDKVHAVQWWDPRRWSTEQQDLTAQRDGLHALCVGDDRIYLDHRLTGTSRDRPGLRLALAACRAGDTFVVTKLDQLARSLPDARDILDELQKARHSASSTDLLQVEPSQLRVKANLPYSSLLDDADIGSGALDTGWLE
jgi:Resolvase, N terminal domain